MSGSAAKQRLVALDIGEVSIVDNPANEERFVVTKAKGSNTSETSMGVTLDPAVAANVTFQYLQDMMWEAGKELREGNQAEAMAKMERITAMLEQVKQFTAAVTKAATDIATEVTKAKDGDKDKKVPAFMKEALKGAIETLKGAMGDDEEDTEEAKTEKALQVILKAGKAQFSKERMAKLHDAFTHMGTMYKEADAEGFAKTLEKWAAKPASAATDSGSATEGGGTKGTNVDAGTAATPANGSAVKAGEGPVGADAPAWFTKGMEGLNSALAAVKTEVSAVTKRVDAVEKVEAVSKALPNNGTDNVQVKKSEPSIWTGVV